MISRYSAVFSVDNNALSGSGAFIQTGARDLIQSGVSPTNSSNVFAENFTQQLIDKSLKTTVLSPLNTATGGMLTPGINLANSVSSGAGAGAIGGAAAGLILAAVKFAVDQIQKRNEKTELMAQNANNNDNVLIRAGVKNFITDYSPDFIHGVRKTNRS